MPKTKRVFYFEDGPRTEARIVSKAIPKTLKSQTTLEAFYALDDLWKPQFFRCW